MSVQVKIATIEFKPNTTRTGDRFNGATVTFAIGGADGVAISAAVEVTGYHRSLDRLRNEAYERLARACVGAAEQARALQAREPG